MKSLKKVIIFGGTHGNEWTGVAVVQHYAEYLRKKYPELDLEFIVANPEARFLNRRFKDEDLNRAFQYLSEDRHYSYEHSRAIALKEIIDEEPCVVIDLHTTTSNMGKTIIVSHYNDFNLELCAKLAQHFPDCRIIGAPDPNKKYLASQSDYGFIVEVGPVANSTIHPDSLESTLSLLEHILFELSTPTSLTERTLEIYEEVLDIHYPRNVQGELSAYIHSDFQGRDFQPIIGEYVPFRLFSGEVLKGHVPEVRFPIFINEAAYYPHHLAFTFCEKKIIRF
jgi:succinylglutamate desuccinylase